MSTPFNASRPLIGWKSRVQPFLNLLIGFLVVLFVVSRAEANVLCEWFGYCVYESPGFEITIVDIETGEPLSDVHALVEWVQYGYHGKGGPLMVQDAVSGSNGVLKFPAWGPIRGSSAGLVLNQDPVITLFRPGYNVMLINNHPGTDERARVRGFTQNGQTFKVKRFRQGSDEWIKELMEAAYPRYAPGASEEQLRRFSASYLNRKRLVWAELQKIPSGRRELENFIRAFEDDLKRMERLGLKE